MDAVLSEDVDTLMFGCTRSLRHWTAESVRGNKEPTHVNMYDAKALKSETCLDSEGMILVALMSGGDYIPAGVPGCGPKTACEAAKAGFGKELCRIVEGDVGGFNEWRARLQRELRTNESKFFRQKHKAMTIPESFPDITVLGYYRNPAVSAAGDVLRLRKELLWDNEIDIPDLRAFVAKVFNWPNLSGAKKFIRGLAPALLAYRLYQRSTLPDREHESLETKERKEAQILKAVCGRRAHWNTDGMQELRIEYVPAAILGIDLDAEEKDEELDENGDISGGEQVAPDDDEAASRSRSPKKKRIPSNYDPRTVEKIWVLETFVKLGAPVMVETWEEEMRNPTKFASRKARERKALEKGDANAGAMDQFVQVSKPGLRRGVITDVEPTKAGSLPRPPVSLASLTAQPPTSSRKAACENRKRVGEKLKKTSSTANPTSKGRPKAVPSSQLHSSSPTDCNSNPWTLSKRPSETFGFKSPTRYSALGIYAPDDPENSIAQSLQGRPDQSLQQSLASPPASPTPRKRSDRPDTPTSDSEASPNYTSAASITSKLSQSSKYPEIPRSHDSSKPSPRKKRSPLEVANDIYANGQLRTPTSIGHGKQRNAFTLDEEEPLTAERVNRILEFTAPMTRPVPGSPVSYTSELPSPSALLSPKCIRKADTMNAESASLSRAQEPLSGMKTPKRFIAIRESLEGAWKHLEPWEAVGAGKGVYAEVETLDLTGQLGRSETS